MPKSPEQRVMELEVQIKLLEKQKALLEQQAFVADRKAIILDMMIDITEKEYQVVIRKNAASAQLVTFAEQKKETLVFNNR